MLVHEGPAGGQPLTVTVSGIEGSESALTQ
jgi:hypothetical protein